MTKIIAIHKPVGIPSHRMAINLSMELNTVVSHAGNLDPMAEGVLVFLIGPESVRKQAVWQAADKEYEFEVLFGFSTDSYDQLGIVSEIKPYSPKGINSIKLKNYMKQLLGKQKIQRPPYSYKKMKGKPLYWWARQGRLNEIHLPVVEVEIYRAELLRIRTIAKSHLEAIILKNVSSAEGDFRQGEILERWHEALLKHPNQSFCVAGFRIACSKGTYIRSIAHSLGRTIGIPSFALSILRTKNGRFGLPDCIKASDLLGAKSPENILTLQPSLPSLDAAGCPGQR